MLKNLSIDETLSLLRLGRYVPRKPKVTDNLYFRALLPCLVCHSKSSDNEATVFRSSRAMVYMGQNPIFDLKSEPRSGTLIAQSRGINALSRATNALSLATVFLKHV